MESVAQMASLLRHILEDQANQLGKETGWQRRERKLSGADFVQTLIFGWWQDPQISLDGLTQVAARRDVFMSSSGFNQRFTREGCDLLRKILHQLVSQRQQMLVPVPWALVRRVFGGLAGR